MNLFFDEDENDSLLDENQENKDKDHFDDLFIQFTPEDDNDQKLSKIRKLNEFHKDIKENFISKERTNDSISFQNQDLLSETTFEQDHLPSFSSGKGKKIFISDQAKEKAKKLFEDDNNDDLPSFTSGKGKKISISDESKEKAKKLFEDDNDLPSFSSGKGKKFNISDESREKSKKLLFEQDEESSFTSGKGKNISISDESKERAKKLFEDDEPSFTSGKGKKINVSDEAKERAKKLFEDDNDELPSFTSGKGKKINISDEAKEKAKKLFEDDNDEPKEKAKKLFEDDELPSFTSGKGKKINISDEAKEKAKKLFEDEESSFTSGKGKKISISEESKERAKILFEDDNNDELPSFTSGKGKKISISNESKEKAKKLFEDEESSFTSGKGKKISISEESKEKSKKLFEQDESDKIKKISISNETKEKSKKIIETSIKTDKMKRDKKRLKELKKREDREYERYNYLNYKTAIEYQFNGDIGYEEVYLMMKEEYQNITIEWVKNHYKYILWKMSKMSKRFEGYRFEFSEFMNQMIYRYDIERQGKRSSLHRIIEKDESSERYIILMICEFVDENKIEISDGWYSILAELDSELMKYKYKLKIGQKLRIINMKDDKNRNGYDPIEFDKKKYIFQLNINSVRIAKWDEGLGFKNGRFIINLKSIKNNGGIIPSMRVEISKVYPILYYNKETRKYLNSKMEQEELDQYQKDQEKKSEELLESFKKNEIKKLSTPIKRNMNPEELYSYYISENDLSILNQKQSDLLRNFIEKKNFEIQNNIKLELEKSKRNSIPTKYLEIICQSKSHYKMKLSLWGNLSNEDFIEGSIYDFYDLSMTHQKLSTIKSSKFNLIKKIIKKRSPSLLKDLNENDEFDLCGFIFHIDDHNNFYVYDSENTLYLYNCNLFHFQVNQYISLLNVQFKNLDQKSNIYYAHLTQFSTTFDFKLERESLSQKLKNLNVKLLFEKIKK